MNLPSAARRQPPKHAARVPFAVVVVSLVVGGMFLLLALNTASAANELSRHDLAARDATVAAQLEQLQVEVAASAAPGNLARVAAELGMVPAANPAFLQIGPDGRVRLLGSPAPASGAPLAPAGQPATHRAATPKPAKASTSTARKPSPSKTNKHSTPRPTPSATPTPVTTLPGGTR